MLGPINQFLCVQDGDGMTSSKLSTPQINQVMCLMR